MALFLGQYTYDCQTLQDAIKLDTFSSHLVKLKTFKVTTGSKELHKFKSVYIFLYNAVQFLNKWVWYFGYCNVFGGRLVQV